MKGEENCKICEGLNCNKKIKPQQCKQCNSETDRRCINSPRKAPTIECPSYVDHCLTFVHTNGTIIRDCKQNLHSTDDYCTEFPWLCVACEHDDCNTKALSNDLCYECDSKLNPNCRNNLDHSMLVNCPFSKHRGCYHFINSTGKT